MTNRRDRTQPIASQIVDAAYNALEVQRQAVRAQTGFSGRKIDRSTIVLQLRDWQAGILPPPKDEVFQALWAYFEAVDNMVKQGTTPFRAPPDRPAWER